MKLWENLMKRFRVKLFTLILPELVEFTSVYDTEIDNLRDDIRLVNSRFDDLPDADDIPDYDELVEQAIYALQDYIPDTDELSDEITTSVISVIGERMREVFK